MCLDVTVIEGKMLYYEKTRFSSYNLNKRLLVLPSRCCSLSEMPADDEDASKSGKSSCFLMNCILKSLQLSQTFTSDKNHPTLTPLPTFLLMQSYPNVSAVWGSFFISAFFFLSPPPLSPPPRLPPPRLLGQLSRGRRCLCP